MYTTCDTRGVYYILFMVLIYNVEDVYNLGEKMLRLKVKVFFPE